MLSRVFIDRPIFAWVLAIIVMLAGCALALLIAACGNIRTSRRRR